MVYNTRNGENLADVDTQQSQAAGAHKPQALQVQKGGCELEALEAPQLLHPQHQRGPAPVQDTQQRLETVLGQEQTHTTGKWTKDLIYY